MHFDPGGPGLHFALTLKGFGLVKSYLANLYPSVPTC
jgi:hypothetical protein